MTRFLVIFLEIVPVVAKLFFSPPSAYAARIQAEVEREREKARLASEAARVEPQPIAEAFTRGRANRHGRLRMMAARSDRRIASTGARQLDARAMVAEATWQRCCVPLKIEPVRDPLRQEMEAAICAAEGGGGANGHPRHRCALEGSRAFVEASENGQPADAACSPTSSSASANAQNSAPLIVPLPGTRHSSEAISHSSSAGDPVAFARGCAWPSIYYWLSGSRPLRRRTQGPARCRFIFSHHHVAAVLVALIAQATASMVAEVCGAVTRMHCSRAGALSRRDRLYTRSTAREIVRRERLITTSSG